MKLVYEEIFFFLFVKEDTRFWASLSFKHHNGSYNIVLLQGKGSSSGRRWNPCSQLGSSGAPIWYNSLLFRSRRGALVGPILLRRGIHIEWHHLNIIISSENCWSQVYTLKHEITDVQSLMPGLILAIRKVVRLKVAEYLKLRFFLVSSTLVFLWLQYSEQ